MLREKQGAFVGRIFKALSEERLHQFTQYPGEPRWEALARYAWNVAICEAFYPLLHHLEIALRNSIDHAGQKAYPYTHYDRIDSWLDAVPSPIDRKHGQPAVLEAKKRLIGWDAKAHDFAKPGNYATHGKLVAELSFGFWTGMLSKFYMYQSAKEPRLWPHMLAVAFPHGPNLKHPSQAAREFNEIRKFRNRVFHHEPIWSRPNLGGDRQRILDIISWMSPELARVVGAFDRVNDVLSEEFRRTLRVAVYRESRR